MTDTNVFQFSQPGTFADPLTEVLRNGARTLLAQAVEAEVATLLERHADEVVSPRVVPSTKVRNSHRIAGSKAAAFVRWHELDDARVSGPVL